MTPTEMVLTIKWPLNGYGMSRQDRMWLDQIKRVVVEIQAVRGPTAPHALSTNAQPRG